MKIFWIPINSLPLLGIAMALMVLAGCATAPAPTRGPTLATLDTGAGDDGVGRRSDHAVATVDRDQVRRAYQDYLARAGTRDNIRLAALNRLADIELAAAQRALAQDVPDDASSSDAGFEKSVTATIELLSLSLQDYPNAPGNDRVLYKLAKAYDQAGKHSQSLAMLQRLVERFPNSRHYVEARFRLGEDAFNRKGYSEAERAFEDVISSPQRGTFYEHALFMRGWSRFKQDYYMEAVDDFMRAVTYREQLPGVVENDGGDHRISEYYRAIGLAFSYLELPLAVREYLEFSSWPGYEYRIYGATTDALMTQQRYHDAVETLRGYISHFPESPSVVNAAFSIADIWRKAGQAEPYAEQLAALYARYHPDADYWQTDSGAADQQTVDRLREHMVGVAGYYHRRYLVKSDDATFDRAGVWYQRYLRHFDAHARQDGMYTGYGDLLSSHGELTTALDYYLAAALENGTFADQRAAYALLITTDTLYRRTAEGGDAQMLSKHLDYALAYVQHYGDDERVGDIVINAAELAFAAQRYQNAIDIAALATGAHAHETRLIQARSSFELQRYSEAEQLFAQLLDDESITLSGRYEIQDDLALAVYRQAEAAQARGSIDEALVHYGRIVDVAPQSGIAPQGLVDAVALANNNGLWAQAIDYAKVFQKTYTTHTLTSDVAKKLSFAYLNTDQQLDAARAYEEVANLENNSTERMAALWRAGELYEENNDVHAAIRAYRRYALQFNEPFPQYMEAMHKLSELHGHVGDDDQVERWSDQILAAEQVASAERVTPRIHYIAASAALRKGHFKRAEFGGYKLQSPFDLHLRNKKALMQQASELYQQAYAYPGAEVKTEAMYSIATLFYDFSEAVLNSQRPDDLSDDDLEMYEIELEDLAFPLEQKAIELFEQTVAHVRSGVTDRWVVQSVERLAELFPARYARQPKVERYARVAL